MTHVYAGIAGTVGMEHSGGLVGAFRQEIGDNKWQKLGGGLPEDAEVHAITVAPGNVVVIRFSKWLKRAGACVESSFLTKSFVPMCNRMMEGR